MKKIAISVKTNATGQIMTAFVDAQEASKFRSFYRRFKCKYTLV